MSNTINLKQTEQNYFHFRAHIDDKTIFERILDLVQTATVTIDHAEGIAISNCKAYKSGGLFRFKGVFDGWNIEIDTDIDSGEDCKQHLTAWKLKGG